MTQQRHPISWLKLEQYHLGELSPTAAAAITRHLRSCEACRMCHSRIEEDRPLPPLPEIPRGGCLSTWMRIPNMRATTAVVVASVLVLTGYLLMPTTDPEAVHERVGTKGGGIAITLVRNRNGHVTENPARFREGDVFSLRLSLPGPPEAQVDVVVIQENTIYFPTDAPLRIGPRNRVHLTRAFRITGRAPVTACVFPADDPSIRQRLLEGSREALPEQALCRTIPHGMVPETPKNFH